MHKLRESWQKNRENDTAGWFSLFAVYERYAPFISAKEERFLGWLVEGGYFPFTEHSIRSRSLQEELHHLPAS